MIVEGVRVINSNLPRWGSRMLAATAAVALLPVLAPIAPATAAAGCGSGTPGDINGDRLADVAVGEAGNHDGAGAVHVFYGHKSGLVTKKTGTARNDQYFTQNTPGVPGSDDGFDAFGSALALGDFDDDGCADLAIGANGEDDYAGAVTVLYGSRSGLVTTGAQKFDAASLGHLASGLGRHLVVTDLDDDGVDDLAAGSDGEVAVLYGSSDGLGRGADADFLTRTSLGLSEDTGEIGQGLAAGDFDGDGRAELAIGTRGEEFAGLVVTAERGSDGFVASDPIGLHSPGVPDSPEDFDHFGWTLAAGDVDADGRSDLAVGLSHVPCPEEECEDDPETNGAVVVLAGSSAGLTTSGSQLWTQDSPGVAGGGNGDRWGSSLAMGRLDAGSTDDLAIGAPYDTAGGKAAAGSVTVLLGSSKGLTTAGAGGAIFDQGTAGIAGSNERFDQFGQTLTTARLQSSKQASLVIGSFENVGKYTSAGQIAQLAIGSTGPKGKGSRTINAGTSGVSGQPGFYNFFSYGLS